MRSLIRGVSLVFALSTGLYSQPHTPASEAPQAVSAPTTTTPSSSWEPPTPDPKKYITIYFEPGSLPEYLPKPSAGPTVPSDVMAKWAKVAWCETHGDWHRDMPIFDGGLGIARGSWDEAGGRQFAPAPHLATPDEQVIVAQRIERNAGFGDYVPDQNGECHAW